MALLKKNAAAEPYQVPTLAECDETYGTLVAKRGELHTAGGEARTARKAAERELAADTSREVRPGVAELLGDGPSAKALKRKAVAEAKQRESDIETALTVIEQRIRDARTAAVRAAVAKVRPEWDRRMKVLCDAFKVADAAHRDLWSLRQDLDAEDISPAHLGAWPFFLGEPADGRIASFLKEAGYA
ncbi:hypothetical protein [Mesorhizobium sp. YM1C-6-2]|uniref:hypothetical protein n=1 Tax=Mesorhizobium sp. YM1C-6-2 TaxID=1827501 RepID=UPI000EF233E8|nr:hypothetical protein [Mesorhizobium sp. YM1C-6-2]RLP21980.1 hypothetical protein D8676_26460 [Mesorhizobium sp. YM1C-6-2]